MTNNFPGHKIPKVSIRLLVLGTFQLTIGLILLLAPIVLVGLAAMVVIPVIAVPLAIVIFKVLRKPSKASLFLLRAANIFSIVAGVGFNGLGGFMLEAAKKSARAGGGLLGGLGCYPIGSGILLIVLCARSLVLLWPIKPLTDVVA